MTSVSDVVIHGCDTNPSCLGYRLADKSFTVPSGTDDEYIPILLKYCEQNKIDLLIPCADEELLPISKSKFLFEKIGCRVLISPESALKIVLNKAKLFQHCQKSSLSEYIPKYYVCKNVNEIRQAYKNLLNLGHKVCIKPAVTHGSRGFRIIEKTPTKEEFFNKKASPHNITIEMLCQILGTSSFPDILVMEYLPGIEYSVDCFKSEKDFLCVPRTREIIKDGICVSGRSVENNSLIAASKQIYNELGLCYNANIQFKYDSQGNPKLLEINPRFSGTMEHCRAAGINFVEVAIHTIFNMQRKKYKVNWGVKMTRVWSEIFEDDEGLWVLTAEK